MPKLIPINELEELSEEGAELSYGKREIFVALLTGLVDQVQRIANADHNDLITAIKDLAVSMENGPPIEPVDLAPLMELIMKMQNPIINLEQQPVTVEVLVQPAKKVPYRFDIEHNNRDVMTSIIATPLGDDDAIHS